MRHGRRGAALVLLTLACAATSGCVYTIAGANPPPLAAAAPPPPPPPRVEQTVGDFAFTLEGGKMITSNYAGRLLNDAILKHWKARGYISEATYVEAGRFSGSAPYQITLSGSQYGDSSLLAQVLSGLTLFLLPYSVEQQYDVQYALTDVASGQTYHASIAGSDEAWVELFLVFALPVGQRGHEETIARLGDHLYAQLRAQGAFAPPPPAAPPSAAP
ncbi:MAG: hypothetical protein SF182_30515 [Deltaproteobacteria bacterium]|nr:hypothetical protein [Deltaproteobacteria bacterium]